MLLPCYCHDVAMLLPCYASRPYPSHPVSHLDMKAITHQGNEPELRQYIKDHLDIGVHPDIGVYPAIRQFRSQFGSRVQVAHCAQQPFSRRPSHPFNLRHGGRQCRPCRVWPAAAPAAGAAAAARTRNRGRGLVGVDWILVSRQSSLAKASGQGHYRVHDAVCLPLPEASLL